MFSMNGQIVHILGFVGHMIFVKTTQLCCWGVKALWHLPSLEHGGDALDEAEKNNKENPARRSLLTLLRRC